MKSVVDSNSPKKPIRLTPEALRKMNQFDPANRLTDHISYPNIPAEARRYAPTISSYIGNKYSSIPLPKSPSPQPEAPKNIQDLKPSFNAYDGTPIVIVPVDYSTVVASTFAPGIYGMDIQTDSNNNTVRLIEVFNGSMVYIFKAEALKFRDVGLRKFLSAKDRTKIGVDLDMDLYNIRTYINSLKDNTVKSESVPSINGTIDIQNIAMTLGEPAISLTKLGDKYVEDYVEQPKIFGDYVNPTPDEYICAANDVIIALKIYFPLIQRKISKNWSFNRVKYVNEILPPSIITTGVIDINDRYAQEVVEDCLQFGIKL